jgi:hypothetical protein
MVFSFSAVGRRQQLNADPLYGEKRMSQGFPESDWKLFRELREVALERLCERVLDEATTVISDSACTHHERFGQLFGLIRDRNHDIARGFDGPKRSAMLAQLAVIHSLGLLEPSEIARFSTETRETIESLANLR